MKKFIYLMAWFVAILSNSLLSVRAQEIGPIGGADDILPQCTIYYKVWEEKQYDFSNKEMSKGQYCFNIIDAAVKALISANGTLIARGQNPLFCMDRENPTSEIIRNMILRHKEGILLQPSIGDEVAYIMYSYYSCDN